MRDIYIKLRRGGIRQISDIHPLYQVLRFPLLFPTGGVGWHPRIPRGRREGHGEEEQEERLEQEEQLEQQQRRRRQDAGEGGGEEEDGAAALSPTVFEGDALVDQARTDAWAEDEPLFEELADRGDGEEDGGGGGGGGDRAVGRRRGTVSCVEWGAYHLQIRPDRSQHLIRCQKLTQELTVDLYCQAENHRTLWVRYNQGTLRSDLYQNVEGAVRQAAAADATAHRRRRARRDDDAPPGEQLIACRGGFLISSYILGPSYNSSSTSSCSLLTTHLPLSHLPPCSAAARHGDAAPPAAEAAEPAETVLRGFNVGVRRVVLPGSFTGGPRFMQGLYQDAMALVRRLGKPDLFVTVTCNPKWPEITAATIPGQNAAERSDLIAR